jgi:hypothetical protein
MATSQSQPTPAPPAPKFTTKKVKDLATFEDVTLIKQVPVVPPVVSAEDALHRVGNDHKKFLVILQKGLEQEVANAASDSPDGWLVADEDGDPTDQPFTGKAGDSKVVNYAILTIAKIMFDFDEATTRESKREAKRLAAEAIKNDPRMLASLQRRAAPKSE